MLAVLAVHTAVALACAAASSASPAELAKSGTSSGALRSSFCSLDGMRIERCTKPLVQHRFGVGTDARSRKTGSEARCMCVRAPYTG